MSGETETMAQAIGHAFDPGEYRVTFGRKHKGRRLKEIPRAEIEEYIDWLETSAQAKGVPLSSEMRFLKIAVKRLYNQPAPDEPAPQTKGETMTNDSVFPGIPGNPYSSAEIDKIAPAFHAAQNVLKHVTPDAKNPHFKNDYATLTAVTDAVRPALLHNGIMIQQLPVMSPDGNPALWTRLLHTSGQYFGSLFPLIGGNTMQAMGSALSYARRYSLNAMCGLAEGDDDGEETRKATGATSKPKSAGNDAKQKAEGSADSKPKPQVGISADQIKRLYALAKPNGWKKEDFDQIKTEVFKVDSLMKISAEQYDKVCAWVQKGNAEQFWKWYVGGKK